MKTASLITSGFLVLSSAFAAGAQEYETENAADYAAKFDCVSEKEDGLYAYFINTDAAVSIYTLMGLSPEEAETTRAFDVHASDLHERLNPNGMSPYTEQAYIQERINQASIAIAAVSFVAGNTKEDYEGLLCQQ